ncbi:hypothetical protein ACTL6P_06150 [Endozoicomonas acroporae]|uniref:hypothetical protein n=1 Tax=Endozoicomonas acroporae TaxID=1701104 RepID=UPI000C78A686|nr:hypothetical protein [Endozoicomonas acroporae]
MGRKQLIRIIAITLLAFLVILSACKSLGYGHWAWGSIEKVGVKNRGTGMPVNVDLFVLE